MKELCINTNLWNGCALHDIKRAVDDLFSGHCKMI